MGGGFEFVVAFDADGGDWSVEEAGKSGRLAGHGVFVVAVVDDSGKHGGSVLVGNWWAVPRALFYPKSSSGSTRLL